MNFKKTFKQTLVLFVILAFSFCITPAYAQCGDRPGQCDDPSFISGSEFNIPILIRNIGGNLSDLNDIGSIVSRLLIYLIPLAGIGLLLYLIFGGFRYLTSAGDPKKTEAAKGMITTAVIGFAIVFTAFWVTQIVDFIFGLGTGLQ